MEIMKGRKGLGVFRWTLSAVFIVSMLIAACGGGGGGSTAATTTTTTTTTTSTPSAPTGVSASAGNAQVAVSWTAVSGAASYNVYYRTSTGVTAANGTKVTGATSGSAITGLTNGTAYYFAVSAVSAGGESVLSSEISATPQVPVAGTPSGVTVTAGNAQATISWTAVTGATSYNVYYKASSGVTTANGTKVTGATSGSAITGLTNGTTYYFKVSAVNAGGESALSSETSATPYLVQKVSDTGQTTCYDSAGSVIACAGTGQDAAYTINAPSYTDNGNGTVTDNVTGLMWQKQDDASTRDWATAGTYCTGLSLGGHNDWRLPSAGELQSIVDYGAFSPSIDTTYFPGTQSSYYWSSTTYTYFTAHAWYVSFSGGSVGGNNKTFSDYARCVRLGQ